MASPAQVANDMAVRADYWRGRSADLRKACIDAEAMIRRLLKGEPVSDRAYRGLEQRLRRLEGGIAGWGNQTRIREALARARTTLETLLQEAHDDAGR